MIEWDFSAKRVLVTGASRGIGFHVARAFANAGAEVCMVAENDDIVSAADALRADGAQVSAHVCDVSDRAAVADVIPQLGSLDIVVNNAGIEYMTPIDDPGDDVENTFRRIIDINLLGAYYVTREAVKRMPDGGRLLYTASGWSKTGEAGFGGYSASKHGILGLTRCLAYELAPRKITVNSVCPGWVKTELSMRSLHTMAEQEQRAPEAIMDEILATQARRELLEPEDIVATYLFLASEEAGNITGQGVNIDHGWVMS